MSHFDRFKDIANDPLAYARQWKADTGRPVVGTLCSYAPEELILAAGALPVRLFGGNSPVALADTHLQAYSCSLVRGALADALDGKLDLIDGMVFPHTCDSIQRLSDIWRLNAGTGFHIDAVLPVNLTAPGALDYTRSVLKQAKSNLETHLECAITDADLSRAITLTNTIREGIQALYDLRRDCPERISGSDLLALTRCAMVMDREDVGNALGEIIETIPPAPARPDTSAKRLLLSGGVCNLPDLHAAIEAAGGVVVGDDLCTGSRYFEGRIDTGTDPLTAMARRTIERLVCPAKHSGTTRRGDELVAMSKASRARGVIFVLLKFCDPHGFDTPYLKERLKAEGIPSLLVEMDDPSSVDGQFQTRCEAFIEML